MELNGFTAVEDMTTLYNLTEESLLQNLEIRYKQKKIYTYTGSILVSVNPYEILPLYTPDVVRQYFGKQRGSLPPHIFAIADAAYSSMAEEHKNQSVIISGESGAGKTEATKLIIQYLASRTNKHSEIEQMIVESSPILEAFGNAKTVRNNNSSRFGKYIEIHFNQAGYICGARIIQYLLEKSRIAFQAASERNYHIFYQLLAGASADVKEKLKLGEPKAYHYLNQSGCTEIENVNDAEDFATMKSAMEFLGINATQQEIIFRILGAVLHLGNIAFALNEDTKGAEGSKVSNQDVLSTAAGLLKLDAEALAKALTFRHVLIRGQKFVIPLKTYEAADARDALAKSLYDKTFQWLVGYINSRITKPDPKGQTPKFIGVLDMYPFLPSFSIIDLTMLSFGFENFKVNSFEQFCINYCNEKLQQHFNQHIFKLEQEEYEREKINWSKIAFNDNQECLDLIEKRPLGILSLLDEECKFPQATDLTFLAKLHQNHEKHAYYEKPRLTKTNFIVKHYAGDVSYECKGFLDKNKDTLQDDLLNVLESSGDKFISDMFTIQVPVEIQEIGQLKQLERHSDTSLTKKRAKIEESHSRSQTFLTKDDDEDSKKGNTKKKMAETVGAQFKGQLGALMGTLSATCPHFVRCVKPNTVKQANNFDKEIVLAQLRYAGMMETIRIRKQGYPVRYTHGEFHDRYRVLNSRKFIQLHAPAASFRALPTNAHANEQLRSTCDTVMANMNNLPNIIADDWLLGATKIFMRDTQYRAIEELRIKVMSEQVRRIQSVYRMFRAKKRYQKMRRSAVCLQTAIAASNARREYLLQKHSCCIIQAFARMLKARKHYRNVRAKLITVQAGVRGLLARKNLARIIAEEKARKKRLEEIKQKEKDEAARAIKEKEEQERQKQERAAQEEAEKKAREDEKKRQVEAQQKKKDQEEKAKAEEKKQELKELGQLDDMASLQDMLKAQELSQFNELNDIVGDMENIDNFSFEAGGGKLGEDYTYNPGMYSLKEDSLANLSLSDLMMGLKKTVLAAHKIELDDSKFKLSQELETEMAKVFDRPVKKPTNLKITSPARPGLATPQTPTTPTSAPAFSLNIPPVSPSPHDPVTAPVLPVSPSAPLPPPPTTPLPPPPEAAVFSTAVPPPLSVGGAPPPMRAPPPIPPRSSIPPPVSNLPPPISNLPPHPNLPSPPSTLPPPPAFSPRGLPPSVLPPPPPGDDFDFLNDYPLPPTDMVPPGGAPTELPPPPPALQLPQTLVEDEEVSLYQFKNFASKHFRQSGKKSKKGESVDYIYSKSLLKTSLLQLDADQSKVAVEIANKIYAYVSNKKALSSAEAFVAPQFVLQKGLAVEELRDEIYSQLIKQTTENPNRDTLVKYWELLVFCSATFLPTQKLIKYAGAHVQVQQQSEANTGSIAMLAQLVMKNLLRLKANGPRKLVPSIHELEALRDCRPILIKIHLCDGSIKSFIIDSAMTVLEVSNALSDKLLMRPDSEINGFTIVEVFNNIERDLSPDDKVSDSLSKFENLQVAMKEQKMTVNVKLLFKKRLFLSKELNNAMEKELVFHQAVTDLLMGVLPCSEEDVVALAALKLQCDCGDYTEDTPSWINGVITNYLPPRLLKTRTEELMKQYMELKGVPKDEAKRALMETVVAVPLFGYSVFTVSHQNPGIGNVIPSNFLIAVDISGMHFVEKSTQKFLQSFAFTQLGQCKATARNLLLTWENGQKSLDVQTTEGHRIMGLMRDYLAVLRATAKYARALKEYQVTDETLLSFHKGDIITIRDRDEANQWYVGECDGREGSFPADHVELLPGDTPPARDATTVHHTSAGGADRVASVKQRNMTLTRRNTVSAPDDEGGNAPPSPTPSRELPPVPTPRVGGGTTDSGEKFQSYMRLKFRKVAAKKGARAGDGTQGLLFTKDPIKESLIDMDSKMSKKAATIFISIMAYMEDYPPPGKMSSTALAQDVIQKGIETPELRDEIFCQIWKQISGNPRLDSSKKGQELLLCCSAILPPSPPLAAALLESLNTRVDNAPLLKQAKEWLSKAFYGTGRKQAPSARELEYLRSMDESMICKVLMPDRSNKAIFVNPYTTIRDAFQDTAARVGLAAQTKYFALFEHDEQQELSRPLSDSDYVCDILATFDKEKPNSKLVLRRSIFLEDTERILEQENVWTADPVAFELTFHQVQDDVLKGKLVIPEKDVPYAAALLVQIRHPNSSKAPITKDTINLFIPQALQKKQSLKDWIAAIELHLFEVVGQTPDYTKLAFLKEAAKSHLFGTVLIPALHKETNNKVFLGISKRGIAIYDQGAGGEIGVGDPKTAWSFSAISSMTAGSDNSIILMTGNLMKPVKNSFIVDKVYAVHLMFTTYTDLVQPR